MGKSKIKRKNKQSYQQIDDNQEQNRHQGKHHQGQQKKGSSRNAKKDRKEKKDDYTFRQKIENNGEREVIEMTADGNCLFRSISDQLYGDYGQRHDVVRSEICNYLEANEDDFKVYLFLEDSGDNDNVCDFDEYVEQMRKDGEWGGDVEIVCAARLYKRAITIFSNIGAYNVNIDDHDEYNSATKSPNILLSYHDNMHYNSVHDLSSSNDGNMERSHDIHSNSTTSSKPEFSTSRKARKKKGKKIGSEAMVDDLKGTDKFNSGRSNGNINRTVEDCTNIEKSNSDTDNNDFVGKNKKDEHRSYEQQSNDNDKNSPSSKNQNVIIKRNDTCPCGSGLRYKKCCLAKEKSRIRLEKFREKHGLNNKKNIDDEGCNNSLSRLEIEGGFAVLNI